MKTEFAYLKDALGITEDIASRLIGKTEQDFIDDINFQDAITLRIAYVGEALNHTSPNFQEAHPEIPWRQAIGMRNRLAHDYHRIDTKDIWATATQDLPELRAVIQKILDTHHA
ncbi:MAG: DUF86 domain-containing protein [Candidatus Nomurabacteria bacterium]|jgi:uncharacterized protein with HEPN domain|nr:DUF86 domain-containing protein [Candidatus Nomurabacteria bacterium]